MMQILFNLGLVAVWVALSAGLTRVIYVASERAVIGDMGAVGLWLLGQLVILSPLVYVVWRDRAVGLRK